MTFSPEQVVEICSLLFAIVAHGLVVVRYLLGQISAAEKRTTSALAVQVASREAAIAELHRRQDQMVQSLHGFREHVGAHYATMDYITNVETRLTASINASESRLTALISKLESRLERAA